jgi:hypothetical protein
MGDADHDGNAAGHGDAAFGAQLTICAKKTPAEAGQVDLNGRKEHTASSACWWRKVTENTDRQKYFPGTLLPDYCSAAITRFFPRLRFSYPYSPP